MSNVGLAWRSAFREFRLLIAILFLELFWWILPVDHKRKLADLVLAIGGELKQ